MVSWFKRLRSGRSRRKVNQPLSLSQASNSLLFSTYEARRYRQVGPAPEPIGKRSSMEKTANKSATASHDTLLAHKAKGRKALTEFDYDMPLYRRPKSRAPSIKSSRRSSIRSNRSRAVQRRQSAETIRSRISVGSIASGSRLSCGLSRLILEEPASLTNIPLELLYTICDHLTTHDLLNLILVCKDMRTDLNPVLYSKPYFSTTYRFAQFVTTISHNRNLAELVQELNLSHFSNIEPSSPLAGWREWKFRTEPLYSIAIGIEVDKQGKEISKHPLAHPLLRKYSTGGADVPLGSLMHIVKSCTQLRYVSAITITHIES